MAQGGIAAVIGGDDSFDDHVRDTLVAGEVFAKRPPFARSLRPLRALSPNWSSGACALTPKMRTAHSLISPVRAATVSAASSMFKIIRAKEVHAKLLEKAKAHSNIEIREDLFGVDLILDRQGRAIGHAWL